jgi:hypothetical protein
MSSISISAAFSGDRGGGDDGGRPSFAEHAGLYFIM